MGKGKLQTPKVCSQCSKNYALIAPNRIFYNAISRNMGIKKIEKRQYSLLLITFNNKATILIGKIL